MKTVEEIIENIFAKFCEDNDMKPEIEYSGNVALWKEFILLGYKAAQPKWIKCSDELPKVDGEYLVVTYGEVKILSFSIHSYSSIPAKSFVDSEYIPYHGYEPFEVKVTHWMPLPAAPKDGEE